MHCTTPLRRRRIPRSARRRFVRADVGGDDADLDVKRGCLDMQ